MKIKQGKFFRSLSIIILLILVSASLSFAGAELVGTTSSNFLKIPPYARAVGMGEAFTAVSDGTYGLYYNPAGIASVSGYEVQFTHISWFQNINYEHLDMVMPAPGSQAGKLGFSLAWFQVDQLTRTTALPEYDDAYLETVDFSSFNQKFSPFDYQITAAYSLDFMENFAAGATIQYTSQNIDNYHGSNMTTDIGFLYRTISNGNYLRLGADATNLGSELKMNDIGFDPPRIINVGLSDEMKMWMGSLLISAQAVINPDYDPLYSIGFEYWLYDTVALRFGYMTGAFDQPTFGLGFRRWGFEADYAFVNYEDLGPTNRFSILYDWGTPPAKLKETPPVFSPNNDKFLDIAYFFPIIKASEKLKSMLLNVYGPDGVLLGSIPEKDKLARSFTWDGKINNKVLPDGVYQASITCEYDNGTSDSNRVNVEIDNTPPAMQIDADPKLLKPGQQDSLIIPATFSSYATDRNNVDSWMFIVWNYDKKIFFTAAGKGDPPISYIWDGKGLDNQYVQTGEVYYYSLMTKDSVGNKAMTKPAPIVILLREIKLTFSSDALFDIGQADVKISAYSVLKTIKNVLDKNPESEILVSGYTDNIQPHGIKYKNNTELSKARAEAVKFFMVNLLGYDGNRIRTEGKGELNPIADNSTDEGRKKNRRVELTIKSTIYK